MGSADKSNTSEKIFGSFRAGGTPIYVAKPVLTLQVVRKGRI